MLFSLTLFLWRLYRHFATMFSSERLTVPDYVSRLQRGRSGSGSGSDPRAVSPGIAADVQAVLDTSLPALRGAIRKLRTGKEHSHSEETRTAIAEIFQLVEEAWVLPTVGRQVAEEICNRIRLEGGLELLLQLQQTPDVEIIYESAKLLEQILVSENRWGATCAQYARGQNRRAIIKNNYKSRTTNNKFTTSYLTFLCGFLSP